jgi:hypothetical protein
MFEYFLFLNNFKIWTFFIFEHFLCLNIFCLNIFYVWTFFVQIQIFVQIQNLFKSLLKVVQFQKSFWILKCSNLKLFEFL